MESGGRELLASPRREASVAVAQHRGALIHPLEKGQDLFEKNDILYRRRTMTSRAIGRAIVMPSSILKTRRRSSRLSRANPTSPAPDRASEAKVGVIPD